VVLHKKEREEETIMIWIPIVLFIVGFGLSWFFVTKNFIFNILIGISILMIYYGVITVQADFTKLIPANMTSWFK
jgi:hypothetical protein